MPYRHQDSTWQPLPEHLMFAIQTLEAGFRVPDRWFPWLPLDYRVVAIQRAAHGR